MKFIYAFLASLLMSIPTSATVYGEAPSPIWRDAQPSTGDTELDRLNRAFVQLATAARPAIVQVRTSQEINSSEETPRPRGNRGSGFLIGPDGYILTAQHVIEKAKHIEIRLADFQRLSARAIASDSQVDLAILKIDTVRELPILQLGDSDRIRVGDLAVVFGYPFGRESSMNLGVISRTGRSYLGSASYDLIQTDAGGYPGGSGGPLLNSRGHVIGMITMASDRGNIGFAIPVNTIRRIMPRLLSGKKIAWGWLGVRTAEVSLEQAKSLGLSPANGALVSSVLPGQPAERGGIQSHDIILSVNDSRVNSPRDVLRMISGLEAGNIIRLLILRDGKKIQISVPLGVKPRSAQEREG